MQSLKPFHALLHYALEKSPEADREWLTALYLFYAEMEGIRLRVQRGVFREEMPARMRYQWWRERLVETAPEGHPLLMQLQQQAIPVESLLKLLDREEERLVDASQMSDFMPSWRILTALHLQRMGIQNNKIRLNEGLAQLLGGVSELGLAVQQRARGGFPSYIARIEQGLTFVPPTVPFRPMVFLAESYLSQVKRAISRNQLPPSMYRALCRPMVLLKLWLYT